MGSEHTLNPTGGVSFRRGMEEPASNHQLLEHILSPENIGEAWKRVRANKGAPGIDGVRQVKRHRSGSSRGKFVC